MKQEMKGTQENILVVKTPKKKRRRRREGERKTDRGNRANFELFLLPQNSHL